MTRRLGGILVRARQPEGAWTRNDPVPDLAALVGLPHDRMVGPSKTGYRRAYPAHFVIFNARLTDEAGTRLWWGDLDLTLDGGKLAELARRLVALCASAVARPRSEFAMVASCLTSNLALPQVGGQGTGP